MYVFAGCHEPDTTSNHGGTHRPEITSVSDEVVRPRVCGLDKVVGGPSITDRESGNIGWGIRYLACRHVVMSLAPRQSRALSKLLIWRKFYL